MVLGYVSGIGAFYAVLYMCSYKVISSVYSLMCFKTLRSKAAYAWLKSEQ